MDVKIKISLSSYQELVGKHTFLSGELAKVKKGFSPMPMVEGTLTPHWEGDNTYKSLYILLGCEDGNKQVMVSFGGIVCRVPVREIKDITVVP